MFHSFNLLFLFLMTVYPFKSSILSSFGKIVINFLKISIFFLKGCLTLILTCILLQPTFYVCESYLNLFKSSLVLLGIISISVLDVSVTLMGVNKPSSRLSHRFCVLNLRESSSTNFSI